MSAPSGHLLRRAAAAMAGRGWHVLPVAGKTPRTEHGVLDATTDPAVIGQWWSRWPDAGIGVACGPSGLLVVDLDGPDATAAWRDLCHDNGGVPTRTARTGRGWHVYYQQARDDTAATGETAGSDVIDEAGAPSFAAAQIGNSAGRLAPGIDTRGHGGYVVAPPSPHPDRAAGYTWHVPRGATTPLPVVHAPGWLIDQLSNPQHAVPVDAAARAAAAGTVNDRYLRAAIQGEARRVAAAAEGRRNDTLNAAAYALAGLGVPDDVIRARLADAARTAGLDPVETDRTLTSGITAGSRNPRPAPSTAVTRPDRSDGATAPGHGPRQDAAARTPDSAASGQGTPRGVAMSGTAPTPVPATAVEARQDPVGPYEAGAMEPQVLFKPGAARVAQIHAAARDEARSRRGGTAATPPGSSHPASTDAPVDADGAGHPHVHADRSTAGRPDLARAAVDRGSVADWLDARYPADVATGWWRAAGTTGDHDSVVSEL